MQQAGIQSACLFFRIQTMGRGISDWTKMKDGDQQAFHTLYDATYQDIYQI